ncbi:hypothetical protein BKI52_25410 [marine bacterium AO1-C]|nr:hypothetical protein BKI52_25410 [marine bacterium AO1-C]
MAKFCNKKPPKVSPQVVENILFTKKPHWKSKLYRIFRALPSTFKMSSFLGFLSDVTLKHKGMKRRIALLIFYLSKK